MLDAVFNNYNNDESIDFDFPYFSIDVGYIRDGSMKLSVLGCAGGLGGREKLTTCLQVDDDVLLDAGTGLSSLDLSQLLQIDHVFISHAHIDHVVGLAFMLDSVLGKRQTPVTVHATPGVIATLKAHLFNWKLWPDFSVIPDAEHPILHWSPLSFGSTVVLKERTFLSCEVNHTVEAAAYLVRSKERGFFFSGDMGSTPALWQQLAQEAHCDAVIVDCSFPDTEERIATLSKHFCPRALIEDIQPMPYSTQFLITHLKPGEEENVMRELRAHDGKRLFDSLKKGEIFSF